MATAEYQKNYFATHDRQYLYLRWYAMVQRCHKPSFHNYRYYGGRGITVCDEWRNDRNKFIDWSILHGWRRGLQIDRIDNDGNYSPENCRWVTRTSNSRNKSNNKLDEQKVAEIRKLCAQGLSDGKIAALFGVSRMLIYRVRKNQYWKI